MVLNDISFGRYTVKGNDVYFYLMGTILVRNFHLNIFSFFRVNTFLLSKLI